MARVYSEEEVSRHNSRHDAWVVFDGRVCDITGFLCAHPGGLEVVAGHLGTDVSDLLCSPVYHCHSRVAYEILEHCCIGVVDGTKPGTQNDRFSQKYRKWREEDLVDWNKPILSQIAHLGDHYSDWVLSPVDRHVRLFHSDFVEMCSKCPWWLIPLFWIPFTLYMMWLATTHSTCMLPWIAKPHPLSWVGVISLMPFGSLIWTLIEYCLHRFIFHMEPRHSSGLWLQFHFLMHGQHHKVPFDATRLVFPLVPAAVIMMLIYVSCAHVLPLAEMRALFAGGIIGYITYEMVHYYVHHGSPRPGSYLAKLKSHHITHHYVNSNEGFGVSSSLWDIPFGTESTV